MSPPSTATIASRPKNSRDLLPETLGVDKPRQRRGRFLLELVLPFLLGGEDLIDPSLIGDRQ